MSGHRLLAAALAAVVTLGCATTLTGCATPEMRATEPPATTPYPALEKPQVERVLSTLAEAIVAGDEARTEEALQARFQNPALAMRLAQYRLNSANNAISVPVLLADPASLTVTSSTEWPRAIIDVTNPPDGATPLVLVLRQDDARSPYRLWQWMHLLPGQAVPSTAAVETGAKMLDPTDGDGLALTPAAARDEWAKAITDEEAQKAANIETDEFLANIRDEQYNWKSAIGATGQLAYSVTPNDDLVAIADEEGGALVAASYVYRTDVAINDGEGGIQMGGDVGTLLGDDGRVTGKAHWIYTITVFLHIPASTDKDAHTRVIAGEKVLTEAVRD